ncbi:F-box protein AFR [Punica granatum]|uniref:F-box protein AFR n=2 Tax=Punica granatum TaxID=22663 RepID=A0A6P8BUA5_PUNGR|nr:F-box protein AFR [Punica granatum]XP_031374483.1 F-box protein AFR [Punica granatum]OWM77270.1 hypothetical protein CDL15_Pgr028907 [Punica granatum]PKI51848.1 hypothetical protein CRG98_027766 [Punica granatum]
MSGSGNLPSLELANSEDSEIGGSDSNPIIPGLPDDIAELCLLHVPYPYQALVRSVCSSWNRVIEDPNFLVSRKSLSLSLWYLFVCSFHKSTARIQWQALDPRSGSWFVLPPMPAHKGASAPAFAFASAPRQGKLFVLGGSHKDTKSAMGTTVMYHASTNRWSLLAPMRNPRAFFTAGCVGGKIVAAGGCRPPLCTTLSAVECYDMKTDTWSQAAAMRPGLVKYDSAVVGNRLYLTEGWTWPFTFTPRGLVYDPDKDTWQEMRAGMREGWTGIGVVLKDRLFVVSEHGDHRLKVYCPEGDTWKYVNGDRFPCEALKKPFAVSGGDHGVIYVVASGLHVGVGRVFEMEDGEFSVTWEVAAAPKAFHDFSPCNAQLLYA